MRVHSAVRRVAGAAFDLVAPPRCLGCDVEDATRWGLGPTCHRLLRPLPPAPCPVCAAALGPGVPATACQPCARLRPRFLATTAGAAYAGLGGELVRRSKYGRDPLLAVPLAGLLLAAVRDCPAARRVHEVVSVPSTGRRRRERGFNLAELIAEPVARDLGVPFGPRRLRSVGEPAPQEALTRAERRLAAKGTVSAERPSPLNFLSPLGVFLPAIRRPLRGRRVLLVDDVLTTGATANACARALLAAGASDVVVAVATRA